MPWAAGAGVLVLAVGAFFVAKSISGGSGTPAAVASTGNGNGNTGNGSGNDGGNFRGRFPGTSGEITAISGSTLTVKDRQGASVQVKTTGSTTVRVEQSVGVGAIAKGDRIMVTGTTSGSTVSATAISITDPQQFNGQRGGQGGPPGGGNGNFTPPTDANGNFTPPTGGNAPNFANGNGRRAGNFTIGTVTKVDGSTITIESFDGSTKTVTTTSSTKVTKSVKGALSDLKVGETIRATGQTDSSGTVTATNISEGTGGFGGGFRGPAAG